MMEALAEFGDERLPLSPAARLTGAASESASSARDKVFARLPWDPALRDFGSGVVRLRVNIFSLWARRKGFEKI